MPRIAYQSRNPEEFYRRLDHMMDIAARSLHIKRQVISRLLNEGLYPYTRGIWEALTITFPRSALWE